MCYSRTRTRTHTRTCVCMLTGRLLQASFTPAVLTATHTTWCPGVLHTHMSTMHRSLSFQCSLSRSTPLPWCTSKSTTMTLRTAPWEAALQHGAHTGTTARDNRSVGRVRRALLAVRSHVAQQRRLDTAGVADASGKGGHVCEEPTLAGLMHAWQLLPSSCSSQQQRGVTLCLAALTSHSVWQV